MTRYPALALVLAVLAVLAGCGAPELPATPAPGRVTPTAPPASAAAPRVLLELPAFDLTDSSGRAFPSAGLRGQVWIAGFIFTRCAGVCPAMTARMARLQRDLEGPLAAIRLVSFTVDPEHDTPEVLAAYARDAGALPSRWSFVTGSREALWRLARDGFKLPVTDDPASTASPIAHSQSLALVDRALRVRGVFDALDEKEMSELLAAARAVAAEPAAEPAPVASQTPLAVPVPLDVTAPAWLGPRRDAQLAGALDIGVFHGFRFTDRAPESGITFVHRIVEDAGKHYMAVHYDHGNGLAVADVDSDGRLDLYFSTQLGRNELWRNLGGGRFEDWTDRAGVGDGERIGVTASFADTDNDGDADLVVTAVLGPNQLFENQGDGRFRDVTEASGLGYSGHSSAARFLDYDHDGLLDLFLCNVGDFTTDEKGPGGYYKAFPDAFAGHLKPERTEPSILYRNLGGNRFRDVTAEMGLVEPGWTGDAAVVDFNDDGFPDLYLLNMQGHDEYFENDGGRRFVRRGRQVFPATPWGAMGVGVLDFDLDGRQDLLVTDMHTDMAERLEPAEEKRKIQKFYPANYVATDGRHVLGNALYHNLGGVRFEEVSDAMGVETYWPWGLSVGDLNADGWDDVFVTGSMNFPFRYAVNSVLLNDGGKRFRDAEFILEVEPRRDGRTAKPWFDLDCSGADKTEPGCKDLSGPVTLWGALGSRSSAIFDLDGDADLDVVTNEFHDRPMVLVSDLAAKRAPGLLAVRLRGTRSNRDGLGARVTVRAGGRTVVKVHNGQSGYLAQSRMPLYFGLGDAARADAVEVRWPGGKTQAVAGPIAAGTSFEIVEE